MNTSFVCDILFVYKNAKNYFLLNKVLNKKNMSSASVV